MTVISSSPARVNAAVQRLLQEHDSLGANIAGTVADVRGEAAFVEVLRGLAPVDHIVFSSVDRIIRGKLEDADLEEAKWLFGVKFWGAVVVGKGQSLTFDQKTYKNFLIPFSFRPCVSLSLYAFWRLCKGWEGGVEIQERDKL